MPLSFAWDFACETNPNQRETQMSSNSSADLDQMNQTTGVKPILKSNNKGTRIFTALDYG